jgi:DNA-directed RNA polymerase specialized sigma24 family protein
LKAPEQIEQLEPKQLAIWISAALEPQRSALALYYIDEFSYREMMSILDLKLNDLARAIASGRREFQAWLNATVPVAATE